MPMGMPYHLEKGPTLRLLELYLNRSAGEMQQLLDKLRASKGAAAASPKAGLEWILDDPPTVGGQSWWANPQMAARDPQNLGGLTLRNDLITKWFGWTVDTAGVWSGPDPNKPTTGYWIGYRGDVEAIVRRALTWSLELALGLDPGETKRGRPKDPLTIELFWKCPAPWFEAWVVPRRDLRCVTVLLVTPSHLGSNVSETPLATSMVTRPPNSLHPVPSTEADYEVLTTSGSPGASDRRQAMWVVTHADHKTDPNLPKITTNTAATADFLEWGIPQLSIYNGTDPVVIVSPSAPAGGVREDGAVP